MGGIASGVAGLFSNQKEGGTNAGNLFAGGNIDVNALRSQAAGASGLAQSINQGMDPTGAVQKDSIQGQLYGQGGLLSQTLGQEQDLANNGFNLTDTDKTAYGEAAGNIARQFGQNDQSLSQALSDRGLSSSGVAGQQFSNSLGNKNEQLAGLQTQIAQNRMQMNQQRLAQTQNFLSQLGQGAQQAISGKESILQNQINNTLNAGNQAQNYLQAQQNQANVGLQQQQQTSHGSTLSNAFSGFAQGFAGDEKAAASMFGGGGGGGMS